MSNPVPPCFDPVDELTGPIEQDIDSIISPIMEQRVKSPILRKSRYVELKSMLESMLPRDELALTAVVDEIDGIMCQYARRNTHPGFFGYVASAGLPTDPLANAMVSAYNQNVVGYPGAPAAAAIERTVIRWFAEIAGYNDSADGVLMGGGSIANMTAIATALIHRFGAEYRSRGLIRAAGSEQPVIICAESAHFSVQRAAGMLGLGTDNVVSVEIDDRFCMHPYALERAISQHSCVVCVVTSAGSTTTGSVDPLNRIAEICRNAGIWLHVDAAYGGAGLLSAELNSLYRGIEQADSITMDLHKWFYMAFDGSVLLYRRPQVAKQLFYEQSDYVQFPIDGPPEQHMFFHLSPELSRRFRALPTYIMFRHYGADRIGRNIWHNVQCARYLAELVKQDHEFELILEPQLSICCFRYAPAGLPVSTVDQMNVKIRDRIESNGDFFMSPTNIHSRPVLRVCIINHATRARHIDDLMCSIREIGRSLYPREPAQ